MNINPENANQLQGKMVAVQKLGSSINQVSCYHNDNHHNYHHDYQHENHCHVNHDDNHNDNHDDNHK